MASCMAPGESTRSTCGWATSGKSGANKAAVRDPAPDRGLDIDLPRPKYLNNLVEQDPRAIAHRTRPMPGFKTFESARKLVAGIGIVRMIKKGQLR